MENRIESFPPIAETNARLLILGSIPGAESLRQGFYYAHPRNAFWPIMAEILGLALPAASMERARLLIQHRIELWDVAHSCIRPGSLDSNIRSAEPNDIPALLARCPSVQRILFNGAAAENLYRRLIGDAPCASARMPSTSPAYTMPYSEKCAIWRRNMEDVL